MKDKEEQEVCRIPTSDSTSGPPPTKKVSSGNGTFVPLLKQFVESLPDVKGMRVLDLGSGTGALASFLSERSARVVGIDASEGMLAEAAKKAEGRKDLEFKLGGAEDIPLEDRLRRPGGLLAGRPSFRVHSTRPSRSCGACSGRGPGFTSATCAGRA